MVQYGAKPSMEYLLHESQVLNDLLDQLDEIVGGGDISEEDCLLCLVDEDAIQKVRDCVSFS